MYKLEFLPIARSDMVDIVRYISKELKNPIAADNMANEFVKAADALIDFPYSNPVYRPIRPLKKEYRKLLIKNYIVFYYVDEAEKIITIARVIYAKRDYGKILD